MVVNGNKDLIIYTVNSLILQQNIPNAQLILYPTLNTGRFAMQSSKTGRRVPFA